MGTLEKNGPAPPEGTGWETNKLATSNTDAHFAGYIGRLARHMNDGTATSRYTI
jgi:hypothetical protein